MIHRLFLTIAALLVASVASAADAPRKPNVLFIAVDDLNHWVGHLGRNPQTKTPNIDRLAKMGVTFTRAYCASPSCNPSRAALMSGLRPSTSGIYENKQDWQPVIGKEKTLTTQFLNAGYNVYGSGKIYHGSTRRADEWTDYVARLGSKATPHPSAKDDGVGGIKFQPLTDDSKLPDEKYVDYAIGRLRAKHDKPFFLAVGLTKPHMAWNVPKKYYDLFPLDKIELPPTQKDDLKDVPAGGIAMAKADADHARILKSGRWKEAVQAYLAAIAYCDAQVGRLLDALDKSPHKENTIIVFWGDHGWHLGEKEHWRKFALWEEATRVPYVWVVPGVTKREGVCSRTVDLMSVYPTLCELCGLATPKHVEGVSIAPLLRDPQAAWDRPAFTTFRKGNHAVRTERWRYIRYADGGEELYDHDRDPYEWANLAADPKHADTVKRLNGMLREARLATTLGIQGTQFTLNGKPTFLLGISYYGGLGASEENIRKDLADMRKHGFNWLRLWATWASFDNDVSAIDADGKPREKFLNKLGWLVAECDKRGIVVDVTLSRGNGVTGPPRLQSLAAHRLAVETIVTALKPYENWYLDLGNERNIKDKRFVSFDDLKELRAVVAKSDPKRLVTASHSGDMSKEDLKEYLTNVKVDFVSPHRRRTVKSIEATRAKSQEYLAWMKDLGREVPLHYQEPLRRDFKTEKLQPEKVHILDDLRGAKAGGAAGWCFHNGDNRGAEDRQPRRSFDLRERRLFDQLDKVEGEVVKESATAADPPRDVERAPKEAAKFGVWEVILTGDGSVANPFDTVATVAFTPPSGRTNANTVQAFYDGGNTWRARVYVSEVGNWSWASTCKTDEGLNDKSGKFSAVDSTRRGRLLPHPKNPRHWITENGRWFLNLNDTAYFLLCTHDAQGKEIPFEDFTAYVRDAVAKGITSFRCFSVSGPKGFGNDQEGRWTDGMFADAELTRLRLESLQTNDRRLNWLLQHYPDVYVQYIVFPRGCKWKTDEAFWKKLSPAQKERVLRHMVARYAAYPQLFWLIVNDAHYGTNYPNNNAFAREVGEYFLKHDPWQHPLSTGHARFVDFHFADEQWASYIHLENEYDIGAAQYTKYHGNRKPVFLGEDRYEQDIPARDPTDMRYFQRRLYWAWLLSGGSTNYGGRWFVLHPYSKTGKRSAVEPRERSKTIFEMPLTGLDSVKYVGSYLGDRSLELSDFEPDHALVEDLDGRTGADAPRLMRRGVAEFLIYHPNSAGKGRAVEADQTKTARLRLDLRGGKGSYNVEWYRPHDGVAKAGGTVDGGDCRDLTAPWIGYDVVVRLRQVDAQRK